MATFWERAAHSVNRMMSLLYLVSHLGFEGGTLVLIATVTGHCLPFNVDCQLQNNHKTKNDFCALNINTCKMFNLFSCYIYHKLKRKSFATLTQMLNPSF